MKGKLKTRKHVLIAALTSCLMVTVGAWMIHAQQVKDTPVYVVSEADTVTDLATIKKYGEKVQETLAPFSGHYHFVVSGGNARGLDGQAPVGIVIIAFDNAEQARAWYDSPAYQAIKPFRMTATKGRMFLVDGVKAP